MLLPGCARAERDSPGSLREVRAGRFSIQTFAPQDIVVIPQKETRVLLGGGMKSRQPQIDNIHYRTILRAQVKDIVPHLPHWDSGRPEQEHKYKSCR